jgi:2-methylisocitrate lyase-like PEP mutase family enzyme
MTSRVARFRSLHTGPTLLTLANAWDAGSARLLESVGAPAIATTSAGMAWALGYPDGYQLPVDAVVQVATAIRRVIEVPLSIDLENGYADAPHEVAELVQRLADAGVDGINIEDGPDAPAVLARKIDAIEAAVARRGHDLFINVRTDVFLRQLVGPAERVAETIARGATYKAAGADGLFVPGLAAPAEIGAVVEAVSLPLNLMAVKGLPATAELTALDVRRLSAGSALAQLVLAEAARVGKEFIATGRADLFEAAMPYAIAQGMWPRA